MNCNNLNFRALRAKFLTSSCFVFSHFLTSIFSAKFRATSIFFAGFETLLQYFAIHVHVGHLTQNLFVGMRTKAYSRGPPPLFNGRNVEHCFFLSTFCMFIAPRVYIGIAPGGTDTPKPPPWLDLAQLTPTTTETALDTETVHQDDDVRVPILVPSNCT